ncbi:MAG TPA: hypothetical protein VMD75_09260 [Candidatus Binataceae bacterium]|nr:hypothetical protein [Candidatus Binataceae bacterium]
MDIRNLSFGSTAAIVTSMGLIVGFDAATTSKKALIGSLLIVAFADNLTDSLSVHIYQEAERLPEKDAFRTTTANFFARLSVSMSFVFILVAFPGSTSTYLCLTWGFLQLSVLSYLLAKARGVRAFPEIWKHSAVAVIVIAMSKVIGFAIARMTGVM